MKNHFLGNDDLESHHVLLDVVAVVAVVAVAVAAAVAVVAVEQIVVCCCQHLTLYHEIFYYVYAYHKVLYE